MGVLINGDLVFAAGSADFLQADTMAMNSIGIAGSTEGTDSLTGITFRPSGFEDGIISGIDGDFTGYLTSRTFIRTLDLVSEGEVHGLVSGDYKPTGVIGETGYRDAGFDPWVITDTNSQVMDTWLRSVYYNDTPLLNEQGQLNFQQVGVSTFDGDPSGIQTGDMFLSNLENSQPSKTRTINERCYGPDATAQGSIQYYPKTYRILNNDISKLMVNIKIPSLSYIKYGKEFEMEEQGQVVGSRLNFSLEYRPLYGFSLADGASDAGSWVGVEGSFLTVEGKLSSEYLHHMPIALNEDLDENLKGWEVRVTRKTSDSIDSFVQNQSFVDSITEVFEHGFSYPNSAMVAALFRSDYFGQVPNRSFDMKLLKVKVPIGYNTEERSYATENGELVPWNGEFQDEKKWTDNPAWIFYDLVTNKRYGLGKFIEEITVDKWTLYKIAQYCDVLVDDGGGGYEPRFSCNVLINTREEAYKVLQDFSSIFRGILYYGLGSVHAIQDSPKEPVYQFINGNVEGGNFHYSSTSKKIRPSIAIVRYNDKTNFYKPALEYVEDIDAVRKNGIKERELTAFGCTSRAQAIRLGRWLLYTENWETDTIAFSCGPEGLLLRPGDLIQVADQYKGLGNDGGRVISISESGVILDRKTEVTTSKYKLTLNTPTYFYDTSLVTGSQGDSFTSSNIPNIRRSHLQNLYFSTANGTSTTNGVSIYDTIIGTGSEGPIAGTVIKFPNDTLDTLGYNVTGDLNVDPVNKPSWSLQDIGPSGYEPEYYTVANVKENDALRFDINGTKFHTGKFLAVESGITFAPLDPGRRDSGQPPPDPVSIGGAGVYIKLPDGTPSANTKILEFDIATPTNLGSTLYYQVWAKTGAAFTQADFKEGTSIPKDEYKQNKVSAVQNSANEVTSSFFPYHNEVDYRLLAYAVNNVGLYSPNSVESAAVRIEDHFPIRDIQIDSLRLKVNQTEEGSAGAGIKPAFIVDPQQKDHHFTWRAIHKYTNAPAIPLKYRVTVRVPSSDSRPDADYRMSEFIGENQFSFYFDKNQILAGGPFRHYDFVVEAIDPNMNISQFPYPLNSSTGAATTYPNDGYDILEVHDARPSGYNFTPRVSNGTRPGSCFGQDSICTEQYITSDGRLFVRLKNNAYKDLKGGTMYLSASGFDTGDFIGGQHGYPNNDSRTAGISDPYESGLRKIITVPFEVEPDRFLPNPIVLTPSDDDGMPIHFDYTRKYYMAGSFFDAFDQARKHSTVESVRDGWNDGQYVGFARPATGTLGQTVPGCYTTGNPSQGIKGDDAVCVFPSRYFSANAENPFKYWCRLNVNGQWEGNGISMIRVLTDQDVDNYYSFDGFYDYNCRMVERLSINNAGQQTIYPNDYLISQSVCRFTQGREYTTQQGVTVVIDYHNSHINTASHVIRGLKTGIPAPTSGLENIPSYNEKGERAINIIGTSLTRPLHGYRRFRIYFDPDNLPPSGEPQRLAPYSVVGFNSWNGVYESWPGSYSEITNDPSLLSGSLFFAKEWAVGSGLIFPERTVQTWMDKGDLFESIPGVYDHHPAGFGQGFGGLIKHQKYFDVHMGRLIDDSYLEEAIFAVVTTSDYSIKQQSATFSLATTGQSADSKAYLDNSLFVGQAYVYDIDDRGEDPANHDYDYSP